MDLGCNAGGDGFDEEGDRGGADICFGTKVSQRNSLAG